MTEQGWIKLYRKIKDSWFYKDSNYIHLWVHLLTSANHKEKEFMFNGKRQKCTPGQFITGRKVLATATGISESKIYRILKAFEAEQLIEQQSNRRNSIITILNWDKYQQSEQLNEQLVNNRRTTSEQLVNTNKNEKNEKKLYSEFILLTTSEYDKLIELYGSKEQLDIAIGILEAYIGSKGKKYNSHYHVLNKNGWAYKRYSEENTCRKDNVYEFKPEFQVPEGF